MTNNCKRNCIYAMIISAFLIEGCMKKQCYTCTTTYPVVIQNTVKMADSTTTHCDITIEKAKLIESNGTFDKEYTIDGNKQKIQTNTTCE
jgi:uncharacterized protein YcfL